MEAFHWISVELSIILGLGITRLLSSLVAVFKSRGVATLDWMPLGWAGCIFVFQLQFWWALVELPRLVKVWRLNYFLLFVGFTLFLFLAAALIIPNGEMKKGEKLRDAFERDGRWGLVALSAYLTLAIVADSLFWKERLVSLASAQNLVLAILPVLCALCRSLRAQKVITVVFIVLTLWAVVTSSPASY